jgi:hypothetical protein
VTRIEAGEHGLALGGLLRFDPNWLPLTEPDDLFRELRRVSVPRVTGEHEAAVRVAETWKYCVPFPSEWNAD